MANNFKPWVDTPTPGQQVQSASVFASDAQRVDGFKAGDPASALRVNSALRQANLVVAGLMQFCDEVKTLPDELSLLSTVTQVKNAIKDSIDALIPEIDKTSNILIGDGNGNAVDSTISVDDLVDAYTGGNGIDIDGSNVVSVTIDSENANGLAVTSAGVKLPLATTSAAGAMSAADKTTIDGLGDLAFKDTVAVATSAAAGIVQPDNSTITVNSGVISAAQYSLPIADTSVLGGVKVGDKLKISSGGTLNTNIKSMILILYDGEFLFSSSNSCIINAFGYDMLKGHNLYLNLRQIVPFVTDSFLIENFNPTGANSQSYSLTIDGAAYKTLTIERDASGAIKVSIPEGNSTLNNFSIYFEIDLNIAKPTNILTPA